MFKSESTYKAHVANDHDEDWTPSKCTFPGCDSTVEFAKRAYYGYHLRTVHKLSGVERTKYLEYKGNMATFEPQKCPVDGCKSMTVFPTRARLRIHLRGSSHKLGDEEIESLNFLYKIQRCLREKGCSFLGGMIYPDLS